MSVREAVVLPQQLLEHLLAGFQHALQRLSAGVMYAGFLSSFTLSIAYLTRNSGTMYVGSFSSFTLSTALNPILGDYICRFFQQFHAKYCVLNLKLGYYEDICVNV
jgi:hypothetical protein